MKRTVKKGRRGTDEWYSLIEVMDKDVIFKYEIQDEEGRKVNIFEDIVEATRQFEALVDWIA